MMIAHLSRRLAVRGFAAALAFAAVPASAHFCGNVFLDLPAEEPVCPSVEWLYNRGITLGCSAAAYCKDNYVTREQMALFLNRMGKALGPELIGASAADATHTRNLAASQAIRLCTMPAPIAAATFPRTAVARAHLSIAASGSTLLEMNLTHSANGGIHVPSNPVPLVKSAPSGDEVLSWASTPVAIPVNTTIAFAIALVHPASASGTLALGAYECHLDVTVVNANPATAPF